MKEVISRRELLNGGRLKGLVFDWLRQSIGEEDRVKNSLSQYFRSPMYSYPLLQEMPWDMLVEEAQRHGIPVEGRSKNDIVKDIFLNCNKEL